MYLRLFSMFLLAGVAAASGQIVVDGDRSEWTGTSSGTANTWQYSYRTAGTTTKINEWIWQDAVGDCRTDLSPTLYDILQVRLASDATNLYYLCMLPPNQTWSPPVMFQMTLRKAGSTSLQRHLAGYEGALVSANAAWDYLVYTPAGSGGTVSKVYDTGWTLASVGNYVYSATTGTIEGSVPWSALGGGPGASTYLYTFSIYGATGSDNAVNLGTPASFCLDFVTTTAGNTWGVVQSGVFDYAASLEFLSGNEVLPIRLAGFTAVAAKAGEVRLEWSTLSEMNNFGFYVERRAGSGGVFQTLAGSFVPGHGTSSLPCRYLFTDAGVPPGEWEYRLRQVDLDGTPWFSDAVRVQGATAVSRSGMMPGAFVLSQNYPNPFNPTTVIHFQLPAEKVVTLRVYDMLGREVALLLNERRGAGEHEVRFDAAGLAGGVYYYRLAAEGFVETHQMILVR